MRVLALASSSGRRIVMIPPRSVASIFAISTGGGQLHRAHEPVLLPRTLRAPRPQQVHPISLSLKSR
jgi:hypothetical protein